MHEGEQEASRLEAIATSHLARQVREVIQFFVLFILH